MSVGSDSEREEEAGSAADEENQDLPDDAMSQPAEDPSAVVAFHLFGGKLSHLVMGDMIFEAMFDKN